MKLEAHFFELPGSFTINKIFSLAQATLHRPSVQSRLEKKREELGILTKGIRSYTEVTPEIVQLYEQISGLEKEVRIASDKAAQQAMIDRVNNHYASTTGQNQLAEIENQSRLEERGNVQNEQTRIQESQAAKEKEMRITAAQQALLIGQITANASLIENSKKTLKEIKQTETSASGILTFDIVEGNGHTAKSPEHYQSRYNLPENSFAHRRRRIETREKEIQKMTQQEITDNTIIEQTPIESAHLFFDSTHQIKALVTLAYDNGMFIEKRFIPGKVLLRRTQYFIDKINGANIVSWTGHLYKDDLSGEFGVFSDRAVAVIPSEEGYALADIKITRDKLENRHYEVLNSVEFTK